MCGPWIGACADPRLTQCALAARASGVKALSPVGIRAPAQRHQGARAGGRRREAYQAWSVPQCGQLTVVETAALKR